MPTITPVNATNGVVSRFEGDPLNFLVGAEGPANTTRVIT